MSTDGRHRGEPREPKAPSRRQLLLAAAGVSATATLPACSSGDAEQSAARALRLPQVQPFGTAVAPVSPMHDLVRQAFLAPSSHNTQCWRLQITENSISMARDLTRRCPAVDPDDHHLYVSLGCAAEKIVHAALATGLRADPRFDPGGGGVIAVNFDATRNRVSPLSQAITERHCTRGDYDGQPISPAELRQLEQAGTGDGISVRLLTARPAMESVLEYVVAASTAQIKDVAFVAELQAWIRFSTDEALRTGDGLSPAPRATPRCRGGWAAG